MQFNHAHVSQFVQIEWYYVCDSGQTTICGGCMRLTSVAVPFVTSHVWIHLHNWKGPPYMEGDRPYMEET